MFVQVVLIAFLTQTLEQARTKSGFGQVLYRFLRSESAQVSKVPVPSMRGARESCLKRHSEVSKSQSLLFVRRVVSASRLI